MLGKIARSKSLRNLRLRASSKSKRQQQQQHQQDVETIDEQTNPAPPGLSNLSNVSLNSTSSSLKESGASANQNLDLNSSGSVNSRAHSSTGLRDRSVTLPTRIATAVTENVTTPGPRFTETKPHGPFQDTAQSAMVPADKNMAKAQQDLIVAADSVGMGPSSTGSRSASLDHGGELTVTVSSDIWATASSSNTSRQVHTTERRLQHDQLEGPLEATKSHTSPRSAVCQNENHADSGSLRLMRGPPSDSPVAVGFTREGEPTPNYETSLAQTISDVYTLMGTGRPTTLAREPSTTSASNSVPDLLPVESELPLSDTSTSSNLNNTSTPSSKAGLNLPSSLSIDPFLPSPLSSASPSPLPPTTDPTAAASKLTTSLKRATSTKHYDADRRKRHDLVSPLRLSPPDIVVEGLSASPASAVFSPALLSVTSIVLSPPLTAATTVSSPPVSLTRSKTQAISKRTTGIAAAGSILRSFSIRDSKSPVASLPPAVITLDRPSTSSGATGTSPFFSPETVCPFSASVTNIAFGTTTTITAVDGDDQSDASDIFSHPPRSPTDPIMSIPTSSSSNNLLRPKHDFNKRVSRDDLYINTRTSHAAFRSYHVPIRGRVPSPKEEPPVVMLVRTQTPDSFIETPELPIGMAIGSPSFPPLGNPISLNSFAAPRPAPARPARNFEELPVAVIASVTSTATAVPPHAEPPVDRTTKKWRLFGGRSRSRKGSERPPESSPLAQDATRPVRKFSDDDFQYSASRNDERNPRAPFRINTEPRVTPEEAAIFQPRPNALKRAMSTRSVKEMKISGPLPLQPGAAVPALPAVDINAVVMGNAPMPGTQSSGGSGSHKDNSSSLLSLDLPDPKLERYSVMFNGILQREGVASRSGSGTNQTADVSKSVATGPSSEFAKQQASLLSRRQATLDRLAEINSVIEQEHAAKMKKLTRNRSATSPVTMTHPTITVLPASVAPTAVATPAKSPAFSLFPSTPSQPKMPTPIPSIALPNGSPKNSPNGSPKIFVPKQSPRAAAVPFVLPADKPVEALKPPPRQETPIEKSEPRIQETEVYVRPRMRARSNTSPASPSGIVHFRFVDPSKPIPRNMPRLRYRHVPSAEETANSSAQGRAASSSPAPPSAPAPAPALATASSNTLQVQPILSRQNSTASTTSDRAPIAISSTNAFPEPPKRTQQNSKPHIPVLEAPSAQLSAPHRARSPPRARSQSPPKPSQFDENMTLPSSRYNPSEKRTRPVVPRIMPVAPVRNESSSLGPNKSALVLDSDDEDDDENRVPKHTVPVLPISMNNNTNANHNHSESTPASTGNAVSNVPTIKEEDLALRNAVEVSIARQISISRQQRQMLQKSGLIQPSPTGRVMPVPVPGNQREKSEQAVIKSV